MRTRRHCSRYYRRISETPGGRMRTPAFASAILFSLIAAVMSTAGLAQPALAQAANYTSVEATSAKPMQLSYHASAHKNCMPAALPTIRVTEAPKWGMLTVKRALLTTD